MSERGGKEKESVQVRERERASQGGGGGVWWRGDHAFLNFSSHTCSKQQTVRPCA